MPNAAWRLATILFLDVVGFSKESEIDQQTIFVKLMDESVSEIKALCTHNDYTFNSTGDGFLFVSFDDVDIVKLAEKIQQRLLAHGIGVRQGINCGKVLHFKDRNEALGHPINMCKRILDLGSINHILASEAFVITIVGTRPPRQRFYELGKFTVKHGEVISVYKYYWPNVAGSDADVDDNNNALTFANLLENVEIIDLSHGIESGPPCTFSATTVAGPAPRYTYGQGVNTLFITTTFDNFPMNYGTHIDFPAHIMSSEGQNRHDDPRLIGEYPLTSFVAEAVVIDVRKKLENINDYFKSDGRLDVQQFANSGPNQKKFIEAISELEISIDDFYAQVGNIQLSGKAILFVTGLDSYWIYESNNPWEYIYFFSPYISLDLANHLAKNKIALVGVDSLQPENTFLNFNGAEPFGTNIDGYEKIVKNKREEVYNKAFVHKVFLGNGIPIVENLKNLSRLVDKEVLFCAPPLKLEMPAAKDNSVTRAFALAKKRRR